MHRRPEQSQVSYFPPQQQGGHAPQMQAGYPVAVAPSMGGVARAGRLLQTLVSQTALMTGIVLAAELLAPEPYRPSVMLGRFSGGHEAAELHAKQEATAVFQEQLQNIAADVERTNQAYTALYQRSTAITQQAYQLEGVVLQFQQQAVADAQGVQGVASQVADAACLASRFFEGENGETLKSACGLGPAMRQGMAAELARTARDNPAIVPREVFKDLPDPAAFRVQSAQALMQAATELGRLRNPDRGASTP